MSDRARERVALGLRALLVFAGLAPFVPAWTRGVPGLGAVGGWLDVWFAFQCHREAARSLAGSAVCVRCLGIYAGLALGALVARPHLGPVRHLYWLVAAALVLVADVASEALGLRPPSAPLRFVTGFGLAYPAGVALVVALSTKKAARS